jgi:hypothetical protein
MSTVSYLHTACCNPGLLVECNATSLSVNHRHARTATPKPDVHIVDAGSILKAKVLAARLPETERNSKAIRELISYGCKTRMHVR